MFFQTSRLATVLAIAAVGLLLPFVSWQASRAQTCNVRVVLLTPTEGTTVEPQQTVTGWAVDLAATSGTGIDAVVASLDGALDSPDNRLIGVAEYGVPRPEVAENLGEERFANSGFTLTWDTSTAPAGTRQLFVQAHSACGWHTANHAVVIGSPAVAAPAAAPAAPAAPPAVPVATPSGTGSGITVAGGTATPPPATPGGGVAAAGTATPTLATAAGAAGTPPAGTTAGATTAQVAITPGVITPLPTTTTLRPPENLRLLATTSNGVTLAWDPPTGTTTAGYLIYQSSVLPGGGNAPPIVIARVPPTATTVTIAGLQDPTRYTYYFTVAAIGATGNAASPYVLTSVSTTPLNTRVPLPPTPPGGAPVAAAGTPVTAPGVSGVPTSAVPTPTPGGPFVPAAVVASGGTSVTVTWPAQVGAVSYNVYGASAVAVSPPVSQQPLVGAAPPSPLTSAAPGTWVPVANNVTATTATVSGLAPGGVYDFLVRAVNAGGQETSQSTTSRATVPPPTPTPVAALTPTTALTPGAGLPTVPGQAAGPGGPFVVNITSPSSTTLTLSWSPLPGAVSYGVLVARGHTGGQFVADSTRANLTTTTTTIDGLTSGSQFTFQIAAKDAQGNEIGRTPPVPATVGQTAAPGAPGPLGTGPFPPVGTPGVPPGTVPGAAPGVPPPPSTGGSMTLQSNPSEPGTANLQWTPLPNAASYVVLGGPVGGQLQPVVPSTNNAAAYIPNLPPGQMQFQVRARDAAGADIAQSNPITVAIVPR